MSNRVMLLAAFGLFVAGPAAAATVDGTTPVICAFMKTLECPEDGACRPGDAEDLNLPNFVRIDFAKKEVNLLDEERRGEATKIPTVVENDGSFIMQGYEAGRGWTFHVEKESGDSVLAVADDDVAFVIFGECVRP